MAIDVPGSNITNGTTLIQYSKTGNNNQQWVLKSYTPNTILIGTALSNMKSMDNPIIPKQQVLILTFGIRI